MPATKLRDFSGQWERPPTCCTIESKGDGGADQDLQTKLFFFFFFFFFFYIFFIINNKNNTYNIYLKKKKRLQYY